MKEINRNLLNNLTDQLHISDISKELLLSEWTLFYYGRGFAKKRPEVYGVIWPNRIIRSLIYNESVLI